MRVAQELIHDEGPLGHIQRFCGGNKQVPRVARLIQREEEVASGRLRILGVTQRGACTFRHQLLACVVPLGQGLRAGISG